MRFYEVTLLFAVYVSSFQVTCLQHNLEPPKKGGENYGGSDTLSSDPADRLFSDQTSQQQQQQPVLFQQTIQGSSNELEELLKKMSDFSCLGRKEGYYSDSKLDCSVFHICEQFDNSSKETMRKSSFKCPSVFDPDSMSCVVRTDNFTCVDSFTPLKSSSSSSSRKSKNIWRSIIEDRAQQQQQYPGVSNSNINPFMMDTVNAVFYLPDAIPLTCYTCCRQKSSFFGNNNNNNNPSTWTVTYSPPTNPWYPAPQQSIAGGTTTYRPPPATQSWQNPTKDYTWVVTTRRTTTEAPSANEVEIIEAKANTGYRYA